MITVKNQLTKKEREEVRITLQEISDLYGDFYITKNNLRLFIKENTDLLFDNLKKGDKIAFGEGVFAYISGFADKVPRKYIKILSNDEEKTERLIKVVFQQVKYDLYAKVKKNNPLKRTLQRLGFRFAGDRGKEILLERKCRDTQIKQKTEGETNV